MGEHGVMAGRMEAEDDFGAGRFFDPQALGADGDATVVADADGGADFLRRGGVGQFVFDGPARRSCFARTTTANRAGPGQVPSKLTRPLLFSGRHALFYAQSSRMIFLRSLRPSEPSLHARLAHSTVPVISSFAVNSARKLRAW